MPTPKSLREAPPRTFEDYILTLEVDSRVGLSKIPQEKFSQVPGVVGEGGTDDSTTEISIGFPFELNGITYKNIAVSTNGWVCLVEPGIPFNSSTVMSTTYNNKTINSIFLENHVLFAVWFDDLRNTYSSEDTVFSATQKDLYEKGLLQPGNSFNPRMFAVQYHNDDRSNLGRRLIIRWHSFSDYATTGASTLIFEFLLYENGRIEYRYSPRSGLITSVGNESATIGVFAPPTTGYSSNRFRDFSYELGYGNQRKRYVLGGATYDSTYSDSSVPYGCNLKPNQYWPGQKNSGAVFTFQPPLNLRKVLPRQSLREKDSRSKYSDSIFDDRKSISYKNNSIISYPTTLPRFYANTLPGVELNQNLFSGDITATGSIIKKNVQDYFEDNSKKNIAPFSENKLFENDPNADKNGFFSVGSSINDVGEGFNQSLKSKTQIRLSFRVDHKTKMFGASSSIYYFNNKTGRWQYPTSSFNSGFDIANPFNDANNNRLIEVDRCFNAFGFNIASGSSNRLTSPYGTDDFIGSPWSRKSKNSSLTKKYEKSTQVDTRYSANNDESFTIPIKQPFLIEKAVIEIPIEAGPGWFNDKTRCFIPLTSTSPRSPDELNNSFIFDVGGPGLTLGLFNQVSTGQNKNKRDLILSGTITHHLDNTAGISVSNTPDISAGSSTNWESYNPDSGYVLQVTPVGFQAYGGEPTAVVTGSLKSVSNYQFTGSVQLNCTSQISNGLLIKDAIYVAQAYGGGSGDYDAAAAALDQIFNSPKWKIPRNDAGYEDFGDQGVGGNGARYRTIMSINNFGRSCSGFEPSGRSILGKEFVTDQGDENYYDNPFFLYQDQNTLSNLKNLVNTNLEGPDSVVYATSLVPKSKSFTSPYLVFPDDRLILSISKSRPVFFSTLTSHPWTSGSIQHDIKLTTGSINITLYGSYVSNGKEYHSGLNQPLDSDAIHEVIIGEDKP